MNQLENKKIIIKGGIKVSVVGNIVGASLGLNLINGKIKPKKKGIFTYMPI